MPNYFFQSTMVILPLCMMYAALYMYKDNSLR